MKKAKAKAKVTYTPFEVADYLDSLRRLEI